LGFRDDLVFGTLKEEERCSDLSSFVERRTLGIVLWDFFGCTSEQVEEVLRFKLRTEDEESQS